MTKAVNVIDVIKGNLESGLYRCFDEEDEFTLNIGYGEIEIFHIDKGLLKNDKSCQFARLDDKLFFRVVRSDLISFLNVNKEAFVEVNANRKIIIDKLPVFIKEQICNDVLYVLVNENEISIIKRESYKDKTSSPFAKTVKKGNILQSSPFRSNELPVSKKSDIPHSTSKLRKIECNNKHTIHNIKEKNNGLLH